MKLLRKLRALFRKDKLEADMAEEMRYHLDERMADSAADGLSLEEARYAAQRRFGNVASLQEQAREGRGWRWLENFLMDLRLGVRSLLKSPGFTLTAGLTLALGIGANTAMFSVLNGIMLKPLPYAENARLESIHRVTAQDPEGEFSVADFLDLQRAAGGYGEVAAFAGGDVSLAEPGQPAELADAIRITPNFFSLLGLRPQTGRDFRADEAVPGQDRILIISERCWQKRFGGRADIIGHTVRVDGEPHEIVGVLPATFNDWRHLGWVDLFRPLAFAGDKPADRRSEDLTLIGRRAAGVSAEDAAAFIAGFGARLAADFPAIHAGTSWRSTPLHATAVGRSGPSSLAMLIGLSGFVLLIACSNLANLLLARTMARAREFAVRAALGASRVQLLRPLIAESLLLAAAGGSGALFVAVWVRDWLALRSTGDNGEQVFFHLDGRVLGWALAASLATVLAFGLAPALFALRLDLNGTLKSGARGATGGRGHQRFRSFLIIGQFALAMVLLAGAALFIRGLNDLNHRRAGWSSDQLVTGNFVLPAAGYGDAAKITAFHRLAVERLEALPGVASASLSTAAPFFRWTDSRRFVVAGRDLPARGQEPAAVVNCVTPRYFETVGTRLLAGRAFGGQDTAAAPIVFIINQAMAAGLFGAEDPIGRRLAQAGGDTLFWGEIVGVVADVKSISPNPGLVDYQVYQAMAQEPALACELAVRVNDGAAAGHLEGIRLALTGLDPDLPLRKLQTADARIDRANYQLGVLRDMLTGFAVLGLGLACLGIYGVIARTMAQRTGEFAIRLALGASVRDITRIVLANGVKLALVGSVVGLLGALGVAKLISAGFPGMQLNSPPVLIGVTLLLAAVALVACWLPARRAAKVDPMTALRAE